MKLFKIVSSIAVVLALALIAGAVILSEGALHPPRRGEPRSDSERAAAIARQCQASVQPVNIRAPDGVVLYAWWFQPARPSGKTVILLHGIADSSASSLGFGPLFLAHGYSVLAPDSRGHGQSGGFSTYGVLESRDLIQWTEWVSGKMPQSNIYSLGESLGAAIALQSLRAGAPFRAIVAESAYSSFGRIARERIGRQTHVPLLPSLVVPAGMEYVKLRYGIDLAQSDTLAAVAGAHIPILLIHGLDDHRTDPANSLAMAEANPQWVRLWLVPGAEHTAAYKTAPAEFERRVLNLFK
ncbi:MAG TPA: alpha/beta fold hydrolase [Bryobacteraceae bacterium]|nr:alpha/beta fold hydrolase [Bryobacteraceae bacterium]